MRKLILLSLVSLVVSAQNPVLVGHRGSLYGVENTCESFENGIKLGYDFLETDVRVTADSIIVCSHDEDNYRLGGSLKIADSKFEELKAQNLRQKRRTLSFNGNIASFEEYLDICKDGGVKPLIELKWSTGINSNDFSNIPLLVKLLDEKGFRDSCIIITSMKPCLEHIRLNYPDIKLQFLTGQYWRNHFEWCKEWNIDADIQRGHFDEGDIKKFHEAGLKVNVWTVNDRDDIQRFIDMGCDYITTDFQTLP